MITPYTVESDDTAWGGTPCLGKALIKLSSCVGTVISSDYEREGKESAPVFYAHTLVHLNISRTALHWWKVSEGIDRHGRINLEDIQALVNLI